MQDSANSVQYAAFYADCEHELSPITSGMRLVLVYNLVWVGAPADKPLLDSKTPDDPERTDMRLQQALQAWEDDIAAGGQQKRIALLLGEAAGNSMQPWCCLWCYTWACFWVICALLPQL